MLPIRYAGKIRKQLPISPEKSDDYASRLRRIQVPARTVLLREGEVSRRAYIIEKGCPRVGFNNRGDDMTFQFFFENQTASSIESFRTNTPSLFSIEFIVPCTLWWIGRPDLDAIFAEVSSIPAVQQQLLKILFDRTLNYMEHFQSSGRDTPQERYENLLAQRPYIVQLVS